jgi:hypothetical protein
MNNIWVTLNTWVMCRSYLSYLKNKKLEKRRGHAGLISLPKQEVGHPALVNIVAAELLPCVCLPAFDDTICKFI